MHLTALCPTYGRPRLLKNVLALFLAQQLRPNDTAELLICADDGLIDAQDDVRGPFSWRVIQTNKRFQTLPEKYNYMIKRAGPTDAFVCIDDDDVYLPNTLAGHANALEEHAWSHPRIAYSDYGIDLTKAPPVVRELNHSHYHGALAVHADTMKTLRGYELTDKSCYDKLHMTRLRKIEKIPGEPPPFYIYRWSNSGYSHISARIVNGKYTTPTRHEEQLSGLLTPVYDNQTLAILEWFNA